MRRALGAVLVATTCLFVGAVAQGITISGGVRRAPAYL
jgi:hypothetical protein